MSQNPLLGNRISLISKKNIRYEGTLYSINESDATVALQDVRSFGTEGREETEGGNFVGPQDTVHPYLLFRGCDIKDLHVHENQEPTTKEEELPADPAILSAEVPEEVKQQQEAKQNQLQQQQKQEVKQSDKPSKTAKESSNKGGGDKPRRPRKQKGPTAAVGTGASLLNRKARGAVDGGLQTPQDDFDFESNLVEFNNKEEEDEEDYDEEDGAAYEKDDFFDSISCDALDKQSGVDNRLRGAAERNLNTETFGAVALNGQRRGRRYYGGRGRGRGGGRGRGRGRGGGRGSRSGPRPRENNRWRREGSDRQGDGQRPAQTAS